MMKSFCKYQSSDELVAIKELVKEIHRVHQLAVPLEADENEGKNMV